MYPRTKWIHTLVFLASIVTINATNVTTTSIRCEEARLKCAYRKGCGGALEQYLTSCAGVFQGDSARCPETCQYALIALTSTDEGKELMTCECAKDDIMCIRTKQRVEICRSPVSIVMNKTRLSCRIATSICNADPLCSTALYYYNELCKAMFHGKKCTHRCRNSIGILQRQEKAAKLNTCICDGSEDYDCQSIHRNMNFLCFGRVHHEYHEIKKTILDSKNNEKSENVDASGSSIYFLSRTNFILPLTVLFVLKGKESEKNRKERKSGIERD
ncbi:growth arrest-specific protein 1-like isoform X2 [Chelonus insularis]|uniref:growth arrest-specific protein 1-like isoform X2 n=1 Tax=Chelonus insularis TaxID=460826 RepID=UPI00158E13C8|nr:growth arrest-specific protein 1-like isoform X2 [Chelonus insularis]